MGGKSILRDNCRICQKRGIESGCHPFRLNRRVPLDRKLRLKHPFKTTKQYSMCHWFCTVGRLLVICKDVVGTGTGVGRGARIILCTADCHQELCHSQHQRRHYLLSITSLFFHLLDSLIKFRIYQAALNRIDLLCTADCHQELYHSQHQRTH